MAVSNDLSKFVSVHVLGKWPSLKFVPRDGPISGARRGQLPAKSRHCAGKMSHCDGFQKDKAAASEALQWRQMGQTHTPHRALTQQKHSKE